MDYNSARNNNGEVPEWLNGTVSKTVVGSGPPRVRIPPSPLARPGEKLLAQGYSVNGWRGRMPRLSGCASNQMKDRKRAAF